MKNDPYVLSAFLKAKESTNSSVDGTNPIVTISRQYGANGEAIAHRAGELLTQLNKSGGPWIVMDKDLGERIVADHHLPRQITRFFSGEQKLSFEDHLEGLLGVSVPTSTMIEKMVQTIVQMALIGQVIFIGRAAHRITAEFPRALHVRIMGSLDHRVKWVVKNDHLSLSEAENQVLAVDEERRRFASTYFQSDLDNPLHYDLILNTDRISIEEGAGIIAQLVSSPDFRTGKARKLRELREQVLG